MTALFQKRSRVATLFRNFFSNSTHASCAATMKSSDGKLQTVVIPHFRYIAQRCQAARLAIIASVASAISLSRRAVPVSALPYPSPSPRKLICPRILRSRSRLRIHVDQQSKQVSSASGLIQVSAFTSALRTLFSISSPVHRCLQFFTCYYRLRFFTCIATCNLLLVLSFSPGGCRFPFLPPLPFAIFPLLLRRRWGRNGKTGSLSIPFMYINGRKWQKWVVFSQPFFLHVALKNGKKWLKLARKNLRCNYLLASFYNFPSLHDFSHR